MPFNSYLFILLFLPLTFTVYFYLNKRKLESASKVWLILSSLLFYGWWNLLYLPLIAGSILFNFALNQRLRRISSKSSSRFILFIGIFGNLGLLAYFKYMDFFISTFNAIAGANLPLLRMTLPIGISFYTLTQIAYLVDTWKGGNEKHGLLQYTLFVSFFPYLLAGPIIYHKEVIPQFESLQNKRINYKHIAQGLTLFLIGLFKKVIIADSIALWANQGFDDAPTLNFIEAWATSLSYTLQVYFDFSGYTDMALGSALLFNIKLPINFNSPYRSLSIQEFWRRWHITLGRFMRDYIYIPLGGSRVSDVRLYGNILFTFFLVGIWHGGGWTFILWGLLHGVGLILTWIWRKTGVNLPKFISWFLTFHYVNIAWVFFRARSFDDALKVLEGMVGMTGIVLPERLNSSLSTLKDYGITFGTVLFNIEKDGRLITLFFLILLFSVFFKNSNEWVSNLKPDGKLAFILALMTLYALLNLRVATEFIYFTF